MVFALLATFSSAFEAPLPDYEFKEYVSAPADPRRDTANLARATPGVVEDLDDEADEAEADNDEATFLVLATLDCAAGAEYQAADSRLASFRRPSAHFGTGPPTL